MDITFRTMRSSDIDAGLRLTRAAHWNQLRRDWELFLKHSPDGCWVAEKSGTVIGTSATIRYQERFSWIGMVLVDPEERGRGTGKELLLRALEVLSQEACVRLDATPAGEPLYRKLEFREECRLSRMEALIPEPASPCSSKARRVEEADLRAIGLVDGNAFGADRSFLLNWMWAGAPELAWVLGRGDYVQGYLFGRHGHNFEHLGPIVATSADVAGNLVEAILATLAGKRVIVDASRQAPEWVDRLSSLGFREQRPFIRMYRGQEARPAQPGLRFAILGPEFG
ncbi:MAG: N-acetyltransferase [Acidobacteria bacterium]|nr:MAG: N-acetyltransferase [Acidobacteriota bacterium]